MDARLSLEVRPPVRASRASSRVVRLALVDRLVQELSVPVAFFFPHPLDEEALRAGLARALERLPLFAGRLRTERGAFDLACDNSGVPWSSGTVALTQDQAIAAAAAGRSGFLLEPVNPRRARSRRGPLFTVRVLRLADGTSSLGLCWHHSVGDMHSFMLLMRAWSAEVEGREPPEVLLVDDRDEHFRAHLPPGGRGPCPVRQLGAGEVLRLVPYMLWEARRKEAVSFSLEPEEIVLLRESLSRQSGRRLSANDAVCAHLMRVVSEYDPLPRERLFSISVNFRKRAGLAAGLVANAVAPLSVPCRPTDSAAELAVRLREGVDTFATEYMNLAAAVRFVEEHGGPAALWRCIPSALDPLHRALLLTNWSNFGVYEITFGGQTPAHFCPAGDIPIPWIGGLVEGRGNRGLLVAGWFPRALARRLNSAEGRARFHQLAPAA